jgi:hypothetical protein
MAKRINEAEKQKLLNEMCKKFLTCRQITGRGCRTNGPQTLKKMGIVVNKLTQSLIRQVAKEKGLPCRLSTYQNKMAWIPESMQLGPKTSKMTWDQIKLPAVYSIVCKTSGRKYIGSSMTPDLRRAVHLYWLKNYWKWGCSNIFFGSKAVKEDVEEFGIGDFYMEILEQCPDAVTYMDMYQREWKWIEKCKPALLYNRAKRYNDKGWTSFTTFVEIDDEARMKYERYTGAMKRYDEVLRLSAEARERKKEIEAMPKERRYKYEPLPIRHRLLWDQIDVINRYRDEKQQLLKDIARYRRELVACNKALKDKFAKAKKPLY